MELYIHFHLGKIAKPDDDSYCGVVMKLVFLQAITKVLEENTASLFRVLNFFLRYYCNCVISLLLEF